LSAAFRLQNAPRRIALERGRGPSLAVEEAEPTTLHQRKSVAAKRTQTSIEYLQGFTTKRSVFARYLSCEVPSPRLAGLPTQAAPEATKRLYN